MTASAVSGARPIATVLLVGALVAGSVFVLHPKTGVAAESIVAHPEWAAVHFVGAAGFALVAVAALAVLASGGVRPLGRLAYGALAVGGAFLVVQMAVDGGASPPLAHAVVSGAVDRAVLDAVQGAERILGTVAFATYAVGGLLVALVTARHVAGAWRWGAAAGALGFALLLAAGVLVIGAGLPLSPLFAGGALAHAWLAAQSARTLATGVPAVRAGGEAERASAP